MLPAQRQRKAALTRAVVRRQRALRQQATRVLTLQAAFDNAELSTELNELFARAHHESGLTAMDPQSRRTLIDRSRYEILQANSWFKGAARQAVNWVIGRGPFLECKIDGNPQAAKQIEAQFNRWFKKVRGPRKMRAMAYAKITDGSGLAMVINNQRLTGKISLDFVPFEDDQIRQPFGRVSGDDWQKNYLLDGKELDSAGNALRYWILPSHPADEPVIQPHPVSAEYVIDVWSWERPSQGRGIPEMATSIGSGPMMRIYQKAVLDAATIAAKHTVLVETNIDRFADGEDVYDPVDPNVEMPITYGMQTFLPAGHKASQLKAEQPTATHAEFIRTNVSSAGRPLGQPAQVATGDSAGINFAGGQLGRQDYELDVDVQRQDWETEALDKLFTHWLAEAALVGVIPREFGDIDSVPHEWRWSRRRHQDTNREYAGRARACQAGLTSPAFWQEDDGVDPEEEDLAAARGYGITVEQFREARFRTTFPEAALAILGPGRAPEAKRPNGSATDNADQHGETHGEDETNDQD